MEGRKSRFYERVNCAVCKRQHAADHKKPFFWDYDHKYLKSQSIMVLAGAPLRELLRKDVIE